MERVTCAVDPGRDWRRGSGAGVPAWKGRARKQHMREVLKGCTHTQSRTHAETHACTCTYRHTSMHKLPFRSTDIDTLSDTDRHAHIRTAECRHKSYTVVHTLIPVLNHSCRHRHACLPSHLGTQMHKGG